MTQHNSDQKKTTAEKVAVFISKNKIILWGVLILLLVSTVVFAFVDKKIKNTNNMYSDKSVEIQQNFQDWFSALDEDKETAGKVFLDNINEIVESEKVNILVQKALFSRGQFYLHKEEWDNAFKDFSKIIEIAPDSYLASVSLYNSASAKENNGDMEDAIALLERIVSDYRATSPIIPETLFNLGRINETLNKNDAAIASYEILAESYSSSNWTNLAKTRIISLKASEASK